MASVRFETLEAARLYAARDYQAAERVHRTATNTGNAGGHPGSTAGAVRLRISTACHRESPQRPDLAGFGSPASQPSRAAPVRFRRYRYTAVQIGVIVMIGAGIAHRTGALAIPVNLMRSFNPSGRRMPGRPDAPCYPAIRRFRRPDRGIWTSVVHATIAGLMSAWPPVILAEPDLANASGCRDVALNPCYSCAFSTADPPASTQGRSAAPGWTGASHTRRRPSGNPGAGSISPGTHPASAHAPSKDGA